MTLTELSAQYEESAAALRDRVSQLRQAECVLTDADALRRVRRRIETLNAMRRDCRDLAVLTGRYYDRSYHKNEQYTL